VVTYSLAQTGNIILFALFLRGYSFYVARSGEIYVAAGNHDAGIILTQAAEAVLPVRFYSSD